MTHGLVRLRKFKREVIGQRLEPVASVSAVALAHGTNANIIRKCPPREKPVAARALTLAS